MLVTKREVKQASKKLLSLLLAVLMVATSMSVCFGTFTITASAAWEDYQQDPITYLAKALESDTIKEVVGRSENKLGNTTTGSKSDKNRTYVTTLALTSYAEYIKVRDAVIYLHKAIVGSDTFKAITLTSDDGDNCQAVTFTLLQAELLDSLKTKKGSELSANAKEFISYLLADDFAQKHSDKSTSKVSDTVTNTLKLTVNDYKGYLETVTGDYTEVSADETEFTYSLKMVGKVDGSNLTFKVQTGTNSCTGAAEYTNYYHHYIWNGTESDTEDYPPSVSKTSSTAKTTVEKYATDVNKFIETNTFDAMASMTLAEIAALKDDIDELTKDIKEYIAGAGELDKQEKMYSQFYPGYADKIDAWKTTAADAESIATYSETVDAMAEYQTTKADYGVFNWGAFDEATIKADYADFTTRFASVLNNTTVYNYFVQQGQISDTYVKNFRDNTIAYNLEDTKELADALYDKYALVNPDLDGEEISLGEKQVAYGTLTGYINSYNGYSAQVKNAIFPTGIDYLIHLQENLECQVASCIIYFAENVNKDYTDVKTDAIIEEIATAKANLNALNALKNSVDFPSNLPLLDVPFENANTFIDYLYSLLGERFTAQVDNADAAYTEIGRPTGSLTLDQFSKINGAISAIEPKILEFVDAEGQGGKITQSTRDKYTALKNAVMPAYEAFKIDRGFATFESNQILIRREDNKLEYFRQNVDLDDDGKGEYEVTDENVAEIIDLLEAVLKDPTVAQLLGDLINKDEDGNPTGEAFDIANLINGLLESIYTDDLLNTIISFLYPIIGKAFADVWAGLPYDFETKVPVDGLGEAEVKATLDLYDVDRAIGNVGIALSPLKLAEKLEANSDYRAKYSAVIDVLGNVTSKTGYDANGNYIDPWKDANLYTTKVDEKTGESKEVYNLAWGITDRASFIDAACAALSGLEPLLYALILNQEFVNENTTGDSNVRGCKIGTNGPNSTATVRDVTIVGDVTASLILDPITLYFTVSANDGYSNVLAPIFEALGLENIPKSSELKNTKDFLEKGLFGMIDQLIEKLEANPIKTILDAVPNLIYAIEADLIAPLLDLLAIEIYYEADAAYAAYLPSGIIGTLAPILGINSPILGYAPAAMKADETIKINVGKMLDLESMGVNLSGGLKGILDMVGIELPELDTAFLAKAGELTWNETVRTKKTYTYGTGAAYIEAYKEDVLVYLVKWALGNLGALLTTFDVDTSSMGELVTAIFDNLSKNSGDAVAAIVELLNQQRYPSKNYTWFDGSINGESVVGNSAYEIYLNPGNDWTKGKAEYLYENIDAIVAAVLTMANVDLDKETEGVQNDLGELLSGLIGGFLGDKTLTSLAALLAKLDLNKLLNEGKTDEEKAKAIDVNGLVKEFLGLDLATVAAKYADIAAAVEADENYVYDFGVDAGTTTFAVELSKMLAPLSVILDFILAGGNIEIELGAEGAKEKVTLNGYNGYENAIIPLLEALGCKVEAEPADTLEATINALTTRIYDLTEGDVIKNIIDALPGILYFVTSGGLSTAVLNLLQGVLVIVDIIRPVIDVMDIINGIEIGEEGAMQTISDLLGGNLNLSKLNIGFVFDILPSFIDLDLSGLKDVIYDICNNVGTEYDSASTLQTEWKKGAYSEAFDQADLLTVVLSFVLEWATVEDNAAKLDEMLGTDGLIASIGTVFESVEISYGTPNWYYWLETEEEFNDYLAGNTTLPNTLYALTYPNDWSEEGAAYIAENLADLVDMVIGLLEINGKKYDSLAALLKDLVYGDFNITVKEAEGENEAVVINYLFSDETINVLIGLLNGVLANVDEALLGAGYILDVDLVGLKNYTCEKDITTIEGFFDELADILNKYAKGLVDLLFFGDDFRIAKKSDSSDTIVINGGLGYEKGLALILEALGCVLPEEATVESVLGCLADRVTDILDNPVNEVIDLLPNLVYFLNANGAGVAVDNILQPAYALLDKLSALGVELDLAELLGFDLKYLSLADILALVKDKTGLDLSAAEEILVNLCFGKIEKAEYTYKMVAERKDTITVILTTALMLVQDEDFAAKLEELMGNDLITAIKTVFESAPVTYKTPDWYALDEDDIDYDNATVGVIKYAIEYPNNWTEESAQYVAALLESDEFDKLVAGLIDSNAESLGDILKSKVNIYNEDTLKAIQKLLGDLIGGLDEDLKDLVNVGLGAADALLGADVNAMLAYDVSGVKDKETFVAALTGMLMEVEGLVDWLLLGEDYKFFVDNNKNDIITINGGHGYAEGLALVLEALGVENLPDVYAMEEIDTKAVVEAVLTATFDRFDAILADPVVEVFNILPNVLYFINANGLTVAVQNLIGAINALLIKLEGFGLKVDIASLVNFSEILGVETELALDNIKMADIVKLVAELTGLNLDAVADVLVGFALGRVKAYESISKELAFKMYYHDDFAKYDIVTVLATVAIITLTDDANADKVKEMLGGDIYQLICNLINMAEVPVQEFSWMDTDKADTDYVYSAIDSSEIYEGYDYGPQYTEEMAKYVADNFGDFVDNVIYLAGIKINGKNVDTLLELINGLLNGSLYNSSNVVAIRDALAGVLANVTELKVNGKVVGGIIAEVLKTTGIADINAVKDVKVPEFTEDRAQFVASLCDVLEPLYGVLKYLLADDDLTFFINAEKTDAITLKGAEGYAYGIIPLLEVLDCKDILSPADYYAAVEADGDVLLTSILNPLLDRVDEILADEDPAQRILDMLPNLIYFINSNGVDTVVKNTLNAVYTLLKAIEPVAKIDLYEVIGFDLATIDFDWLFNKLLEIIAEKTGYEFEGLDANAIKELSVGKLVSYTSANGKTAYKMVYAEGSNAGTKTEMVVVVERLLITFIMHENNQNLLLGLMRDYLGMTADAEKYVAGVLKVIADCAVDTRIGMDLALTTLYYIYYGADIGADHGASGIKDLNKTWTELLKDMRESSDEGESLAGDIIAGILDLDIFDDIIDPDEGIAPNGLIAFFQKIIEFFKKIFSFFSFGK